MFKFSKKQGSLFFSVLLLLGQVAHLDLSNPGFLSNNLWLFKSLNLWISGSKYRSVAKTATVALEGVAEMTEQMNIQKTNDYSYVPKIVNYVKKQKRHRNFGLNKIIKKVCRSKYRARNRLLSRCK